MTRRDDALERLSSGEPLTDEERAGLADAIGQLDDDALLRAMDALDHDALLSGAAGDALTPGEADAIFSASYATPTAAGPPDSPPPSNVVAGPWRARPARRLLALAASFALVTSAGLAVYVLTEGPEAPYEGLTGAASAPKLTLTLFAGSDATGAPVVDRHLITGDAIGAGEVILFRHDLDTQAYLYIFVEAQDGARTLLWAPDDPKDVTPPGDRELTADGQAMAFDPAHQGARFEVIGVAASAPTSLEPYADTKGAPRSLEADLNAACPTCAVHATTLIRRAQP